MNISPKKLGVHIKCQSMDKSLSFYTKLGFNPIFAYGSDKFTSQFSFPTAKESYCGVTFSIGDALYEVADGHVAVKPEVFLETVNSSKVSAMFDVESVDNLVSFCEKEGIEIAAPVRVYPWGTKEVVLRDPDGFVLVFREHVA